MIFLKYGLLGEKLSHSFSQKIHKIIMDELKLDGSYSLFEVARDDIQKFFNTLVCDGIDGINITIPYKQIALNHVDFISDEVKEIGATNTIKIKDSKLYAYNTDYYGIEGVFNSSKASVTNKDVYILGTGGASKCSYYYSMINNAKKIFVVSRTPQKSKSEFKNIEVISYNDFEQMNKSGIVINCTPVGMYPNIDFSPVSKESLKGFEFIFDLIYNPDKTKLLKFSDELKINNSNGLYMLIAQAVKAQEIWNDIDLDCAFVDKIYRLFIGRK